MIYAQLMKEVLNNKELMLNLELASELNLPQWCIVGGAIRDHFWGLHTPQSKYTPKDIDLIFFDPKDCSKTLEQNIEDNLKEISGKMWSVKNQARMHEHNSDTPYLGTLDAISKFPLQVVTTALSIASDGEPLLVTIYGYQDLIVPAINPTIHYQTKERRRSLVEYIERKKFSKLWPQAKLAEFI